MSAINFSERYNQNDNIKKHLPKCVIMSGYQKHERTEDVFYETVLSKDTNDVCHVQA